MKLAIFTKFNNADGLKMQSEFAKFLKKEQLDSLSITSLDLEKPQEELGALLDELKMCAAMVVFGGDGSVLRAVSLTSVAQIPILAVNLGDMGFLAELERTTTPKEILEAVRNYQIERRNLIEVSFSGNTYSALNDIVLKSEGETPIYINATVGDELLDRYRADGVIVSTSTGSTAYALSAGGPILAPEVNDMLIIPICPHTLHSRSVVVPLDSSVTLRLERADEVANLVVDGRLICTINKDNVLSIKKSKLTATFLRGESNGFYKRLLQKMNIWGVSK